MKTPNFISDFSAVFNSLYADANQSDGFTGLTMGVVISTDDPLQQGRLQVFCPALGDDPDKPTALPWAAYIMPFGGAIDNASYVRGPDAKTTSGPVHYGFWAIPEVGSYVLLGCVDGDYRRRFWLGSFVAHQQANSIITGKYKWEGTDANGPLSSSGSPLEPQYTNLGKAFNDDRSSPEWKSRGADYQALANRRDEGSQTNSDRGESYLDSIYEDIVNAETLDEAKPALGENGYDWSNHENVAGQRSSKVVGFSTPGGHSIHCDDKTYNSRIRIRSSAGHTILLDDTNERIYIMTAEGNSYVELDKNGNVDLYAKRRLSVHAEKDINFSTDETFRVHAKKGIHMYAGNTLGQEELDRIPNDGEIRIHSTNDLHVISEKNIRVLSIEDTLLEVGGKVCQTVGDSWSLQVQNNINIVTNTGEYNLTVATDINELAGGNIRRYSLGETRNLANSDMKTHSFGGQMDIGAQKAVNMKSMGSDIMLEAVGRNNGGNIDSVNGGSGGIYIKTPNSIISTDDKGISSVTTGNISQKTPKVIQSEIDNVDLTPPENPEVPDPDPSCEGLGNGPLPLEGFSGVDLAARAAYNAGFRGKDLVTVVAIAGAESGYNPNATNVSDGRPTKWGPSVGMWQVRTLQQPNEWGGIDRQRDINLQRGPNNVQNNANFAKSLYDRSGFREWSVFANGSGPYKNFLGIAESAINRMCSGAPPLNLAPEELEFASVFSAFDFSSGCASSTVTKACNPNLQISANSSFSIGFEGLNLQSKVDTIFKSVANNFSTKMHDNIISKIDEHSDKLNKVTGTVASFIQTVATSAAGIAGWAALVASAIDFITNFDFPSWEQILGISFPISLNVLPSDFLPNINFEHLLGDICKIDIPTFDSSVEAVFSLSMADLCQGTIEDPLEGSLNIHFNPPTR